ncbi:MAG: hypothetical protein A2V88_11270 [Elusimicrobia bacterium RBG_16_66_12]|nr:MAG: hypothetical protein A2V88_11270 [Elusimicrobia bacterium RBG_16_66_12]
MHPLIHLGPFQSTWSLLLAAACAATLLVLLHEARGRGIPPRAVLLVWPGMILGGFLGAHLYFLTTHPGYLSVDAGRKVFNVFSGMSVQGSVIGACAAAFFLLRSLGIPLTRFLDPVAPASALGLSIGRLGCLAMGCCYGRPTDLPIGIVFDGPYCAAPMGVRLHPTQLYESVLCLVLAGLLHHRLKTRRAPDGEVFAFFLLGYGLIRFFVQSFRNDDAGHLIWGLAHGHYMAMAMIATAVWMLRRTPRARLGS